MQKLFQILLPPLRRYDKHCGPTRADFSCPRLTSVDTPSLQVEFSPFEAESLAVATAQYFGIVGNGRLHVLHRSNGRSGLREVLVAKNMCQVTITSSLDLRLLCGLCGADTAVVRSSAISPCRYISYYAEEDSLLSVVIGIILPRIMIGAHYARKSGQTSAERLSLGWVGLDVMRPPLLPAQSGCTQRQ